LAGRYTIALLLNMGGTPSITDPQQSGVLPLLVPPMYLILKGEIK